MKPLEQTTSKRTGNKGCVMHASHAYQRRDVWGTTAEMGVEKSLAGLDWLDDMPGPREQTGTREETAT